jgi:GTPase SAR1 family protein
MQNNTLGQYQQRKSKVLNLLNDSADFFTNNNLPDKAESLHQLHTQVKDGTFSIVVVGEFSAGKSTFLNALMGEEHLPALSTETTATVNFLKSKALSPNSNEVEVIYNNSDQSPTYYETADKKTIESFVTTKSTLGVAENIKQVNLFLDSPFLNDGVTLVDSPGLNGVATGHQEITEKQIETSHASIMMFNARQAGTKSEFGFISELQEKVDTIFYVLNGIDDIKSSEESVESVVDNIKSNFYKVYPDKPIPEIWPLAALPALAARSNKDVEYRNQLSHSEDEKKQYLITSRIGDFEQRLLRFITQGEKAKQELLAPVNKVYALLTDHKTNIEFDIEALQQTHDSDELMLQLSELSQQIEKVEADKLSQQGSVNKELKALCRDLKEQMGANLYNLKTQYQNELASLDSIDDVVLHIGPKLTGKIQHDYEKVANQLLSEFSEQVKELAQDNFSQHITQLDDEIEQWNSNSRIKIVNNPELNAESFSVDVGIEQYQQLKAEKEHDIKTLRKSIEECEDRSLQSRKAQQQLEKLEDEQRAIRQHNDSRMSLFDTNCRPAIHYTSSYNTEMKKGGGLFGKLGDMFFGQSEKQVESQVKSTEARDSFDSEKSQAQKVCEQEKTTIAEQVAQQEDVVNGLIDEDTLELRQKRQGRAISEIRKQLDDHMTKLGDKAALENKKQMSAFKYQFNTYLEEFEIKVEDTFKDQITKSRKNVTSMIDNIVLENFNQLIKKHKNEIELKQRLLGSSEEDKTRKTAELTAQVRDITDILKNSYVEIKSELDTIAVDKIEQETA